jgi:hypothetical protein
MQVFIIRSFFINSIGLTVPAAFPYTTIMERIFAATSTGVDIGTAFQPAAKFKDIGSLVSVIVQNAFVFAGIIALVLLVVGGFGIIASAGSGDTKQMEKGKSAITGAVIGLLIIVGSFWIIQILEKLTGIPLLPLQ